MTNFIIHHGLPLLFVAVSVESFGVPLPGETALIAFGVLASRGDYSIASVIAVAASAAIVGDNLGYWLIGRLGGRALFARWSWLDRHTERLVTRAETFMQRQGGKAVFLGRFVSIVRFTIAWVAGLTRMPWPRFLFWNAAGGTVWAIAIGLIAFYGGQAAAQALSRYGLYAGGAVVAGVLATVGVAKVAHRRVAERDRR